MIESDAAAMIGIHPETLARYRREGRVPTWRQVGRLIKYTPDDVDRAIASFEKAGPDLAEVERTAQQKVLKGRFG
jgi:predicted site-specific integrase-resolvase